LCPLNAESPLSFANRRRPETPSLFVRRCCVFLRVAAVPRAGPKANGQSRENVPMGLPQRSCLIAIATRRSAASAAVDAPLKFEAPLSCDLPLVKVAAVPRAGPKANGQSRENVPMGLPQRSCLIAIATRRSAASAAVDAPLKFEAPLSCDLPLVKVAAATRAHTHTPRATTPSTDRLLPPYHLLCPFAFVVLFSLCFDSLSFVFTRVLSFHFTLC
jgi:hypothetical protein